MAIIQHLGYDIKIIPVDHWREKLRKIDSNNALMPLVDYYDSDENIDFIKIDNTNTINKIHQLGISLTCDYSELFSTYLKFWKQQNISEYL